MRRELRALGARALQCIAPLRERRCAACALPVPAAFAAGGPPLCDACGKDLARRTGGYCPRCGDLTAADDLPPASCGVCLTTGRPWDALFFHGEYQGLLRALILRLKRGRELS
ncbi:MAG: ComF family protein, partial [Deltaproteobacteria bacterium]|nr:ComF family protein [Deltaproteobacteria bacterium]